MSEERIVNKGKTDELLAGPKDLLTAKQIAKLDLEIEDLREKSPLEIKNLEKRNRWDFHLQVIPLVTTAFATLGLVMSLYLSQIGLRQERLTREVDQRLKIQTQIRTDGDEILKVAQDKTQPLARVSFFLGDLNALASGVSAQQMGVELVQAYKRPFTESLVLLIINDLDFETHPRDTGFPVIALEHWDDYGTYLRENPDKLKFILFKYVSAMRYLHDTNISYIEAIRYHEPTSQYIILPEYRAQEGERRLYRRFSDIRVGFTAHLKLAADNPLPEARAIKAQNVLDFEDALCNPKVAKGILQADFTGRVCVSQQ